MQDQVAALTMVRDDSFFLQIWLRHYGRMLGLENCYIVNHGRSDAIHELAQGANVLGLPGTPFRNFDMKRWRLLNHVMAGLRCYYTHVIVGDVDELVVMDPRAGETVLQVLERTAPRQILTPVGLEVLHRIDLEQEPVDRQVLGPRRHVRPAPHYSKPCIVSTQAKLARGGHFADHPKLEVPQDMYLMHLKYCDFATYCEVLDRRNETAKALGVSADKAMMGGHWFPENRADDRATFEAFAQIPLAEGFDLDWLRERMRQTWRPRGEKGMWQVERPDYGLQYRLPQRFVGIL